MFTLVICREERGDVLLLLRLLGRAEAELLRGLLLLRGLAEAAEAAGGSGEGRDARGRGDGGRCAEETGAGAAEGRDGAAAEDGRRRATPEGRDGRGRERR